MSDNFSSRPSWRRRPRRQYFHLKNSGYELIFVCFGIGLAVLRTSTAAADLASAGVASSKGDALSDHWQQQQQQQQQQPLVREQLIDQHQAHHHRHQRRRLHQGWKSAPAARSPSPPSPTVQSPPPPKPSPVVTPMAAKPSPPSPLSPPSPSPISPSPTPSPSPPSPAPSPSPMAGKPSPPSPPSPPPVRASPAAVPPTVFIKPSPSGPPPPSATPAITPVTLIPPVPVTGVVQNLLSSNYLYAIKYQGLTSTELYATTAESGFTKLAISLTTPLPKTSPSTYQFMLGPNEDLYAVNMTDITRPVLNVLARASSYNAVTKYRVGLSEGVLSNVSSVQCLLSANADLFVLKPSGPYFVDMYILPRSLNYSRVAVTIHTSLYRTNASTYRFQLGLNDDLYAIKYGGGASGNVEVTVLTKASYYQAQLTLVTDFPRTTDMAFQWMLLTAAKQQATLYAVQNGGRVTLSPPPSPPPPPQVAVPKPPPPPVPMPPKSPPSPPSPPPVNCSAGFTCILPPDLASIPALRQDPLDIVGGGFLFTGSGKIFEDFPISDMVATAATSARVKSCPYLSLSANQLTQLAGGARYVGGLLSSELGGVPQACAAIVGRLSNTTRYIIGMVSVELYVYAPSVVTAHDMEVLQGSNMSICAAIDPCSGVYQIGFNTQAAPPGQELGLFQDPYFSCVLTITSMSFSTTDPAGKLLTLELQRLWIPAEGPTSGGSLTNTTFRHKFALTGTPEGIVDSFSELGASLMLVPRGGGNVVASLTFVDEARDKIHLAWNPLVLGNGTEGGDILMALNLSGVPRMSFANGFQEFDLSGHPNTTSTIHGLWASYLNGTYVLQLSTITPLRMEDVLSRLGSNILRTVYGLFSDYSYNDNFGTLVSFYIAPGTFSLRVDVSFDQPGGATPSLDTMLRVPNPTDGKLGVMFVNGGSGPYDVYVISNGRTYSIS